MIFTLHQILLGLEIKQVDISGTCGTHRRKEKKVQSVSRTI